LPKRQVNKQDISPRRDDVRLSDQAPAVSALAVNVKLTLFIEFQRQEKAFPDKTMRTAPRFGRNRPAFCRRMKALP
jgi:hypothetical protein